MKGRREVNSRVPQGSVQEWVVVNLFTNYLEKGVNNEVANFTADPK